MYISDTKTHATTMAYNEIVSHTDACGAAKPNQPLSAERIKMPH
jgi:hypothetical protein